MKKSILTFSLVALLTALLPNIVVSADYTDIYGDFPKVIFGDAQLAKKTYSYNPAYPTPSAPDYEMLDELGINIVHTWFLDGYTWVLEDNINTPGLKIFSRFPDDPNLNTYTNRAWDALAYDDQAVNYENLKGAYAYLDSNWYGYCEETIDPYLGQYYYVYHGISGDDSPNWPYRSLMYAYCWPEFKYYDDDPNTVDEREAYVRIKMRRSDVIYPPITEPLVKIRVWESKKHDPYSSYTGSYDQTFEITDGDITTDLNYGWIDLNDFTPPNDPIVIHGLLKDDNNQPCSTRFNIDVNFTRHCDIYIDSLAIYDSTGYNLGYYYHHDNTNTVFTQRIDKLDEDLDTFFGLHSNVDNLLLDWIVDDTWPCRLINSIVIDSIMYEYDNALYTNPSHRLIINNPWGKNWWIVNNTTGFNLINFAGEYLELAEFDDNKPYQLFSYYYPFGENSSDLQGEIDTLIGRSGEEGRGLRYTQYIADLEGVYPWWYIQCQKDGTSTEVWHRNPTNEEI